MRHIGPDVSAAAEAAAPQRIDFSAVTEPSRGHHDWVDMPVTRVDRRGRASAGHQSSQALTTAGRDMPAVTIVRRSTDRDFLGGIFAADVRKTRRWRPGRRGLVAGRSHGAVSPPPCLPRFAGEGFVWGWGESGWRGRLSSGPVGQRSVSLRWVRVGRWPGPRRMDRPGVRR